MSAVNDRHLTLQALDAALKRRGPAPGLLHHSDQGCTYASHDYQRVLEARGIVCIDARAELLQLGLGLIAGECGE